MKFIHIILLSLAISITSCKENRNTIAISTESADSLVYPSPSMDMTLYYQEDSIKVVQKVQKTFVLSKSLSAQAHNVKADYHIICNEKHWLQYITISYSSNDFETLDKLIQNLESTFKESSTFKWDEDKCQYTNGKYYIYFQPPTRDERSGDIFAVCCIMPIDLVNK
jgi:hypothetical protein